MRYPSVAALIFAIAPPLSGQTSLATKAPITQAATAQSRTERALLRLEDDWAKALVRRDAAAFRRLLTPRFVYTEDASVMNKEELVRAMTSGSDTVERAKNEGLKVYDYGTTAIVTGILAVQGKGKDGPFNRRYRFTDTWLYRNGRWQVIAAQDYLIPR